METVNTALMIIKTTMLIAGLVWLIGLITEDR